jgi:thiol-disulfide isomerase/thioredoxin
MKRVLAAPLLLLAITALMTACGAPARAQVEAISLAGDTNLSALAAAERGELGKPTIVFFHAQWCHVCQRARPDMADIAEEYRDTIAVVRMDIDNPASRPAIEHYEITSTPTFVLLAADGNVLAMIPDWPGRPGMEGTIAQLLAAE